MAQPGAHQILMRGDSEGGGEYAKEMVRAEAGFARGAFQVDLAVRVGIDPQCGLDRATALARGGRSGLRRLSRYHRHEAARKQMADFVETNVAAPAGPGLGKLAEHHQSRQWRNGADLPDVSCVVVAFVLFWV